MSSCLVVSDMFIRDRRSGMGFSFMEAFMDEIEVISKVKEGTTVKMKKTIGKGRGLWTTQSL